MNNSQVCKFFIKGNCNHGDNCKYIHDETICKNYYLNGSCNNKNNCKFKHTVTIDSKINKKHKKKLVKKNTESFEPSYEVPDVKIKVGLQEKYQENDIVLIPNLFCEENDNSIYEKLLSEIKNPSVFKLWHGDTHLIADDKLNWKDDCPTFNMIINKLKETFKMDVKATRFNWYKDTGDWKPYHHDAAAVDPRKAKIQNFTIGVSFGKQRDASFQHAKTRTVLSIPQPNGQVYGFGKSVNINWRHGIPRIPDKDKENKGRISIIAWGYVKN